MAWMMVWMMVLLIDNYDSFVHNLARYLRRLGVTVEVVRNDAVDAEQVRRKAPEAIVLSPGPCTPEEAGCCVDLVQALWNDYPILGICLGHQAIVAAFGGDVVRSSDPMHGRTSEIFHDGKGVFADVPSPFVGCRYHSLIADRAALPADLVVTSWTPDGIVMGVRHVDRPVVGLQFHPEAILTEHGYLLLFNFLRMAGISVPERIPSRRDELRRHPHVVRELPDTPITF